MRTTRIVLAGAFVALALVAAPLGPFAIASTAEAYVCPVTGDVREDVDCRLNQCGGFDPKRPLDALKPRMCPD